MPRARAGRNSYRNLVSSCLECNSLKGERPATDFLRCLYRQRCLTASELNARLRALDALASGKLPLPSSTPTPPLALRLFLATRHSSLATAVQTLCLARAAIAFRSAAQPFLISDSPIGISSG